MASKRHAPAKSNFLAGLIGAAAVLVVVPQGATLWPVSVRSASSSVLNNPPQQMVDRSRKGDSLQPLWQITNRGAKPTVIEPAPAPPPPPRPATKPRLPVGCEPAVSSLASILDSASAVRCLS